MALAHQPTPESPGMGAELVSLDAHRELIAPDLGSIGLTPQEELKQLVPLDPNIEAGKRYNDAMYALVRGQATPEQRALIARTEALKP